MCAYIMREAPGLPCLLMFLRCDGHMLHTSASIALWRSSAANAIYSAALLLRAASHRWRMHRALREIVEDELVWSQGGQQRPSDREHAELVLRLTLLRHSKVGEKSTAASLAEELLQVLNGDWTVPRLAHRCQQLPNGRFCCRTRHAAVTKVVDVLAKVFLNRLPPVPALNKWLACFPMLTWIVLGTMVHNVMHRVWAAGILAIPSIILAEDLPQEDGEQPPREAQPVDNEDQQQQQEDVYRKQRSKRASRVHRWMKSSISQMWTAVALFTTEAGSNVQGYFFLADEFMFSLVEDT